MSESNRELAARLTKAENAGDDAATVEALSEICERLGLPLDWTEQGLNLKAACAVENFLTENG